MKIKVLLASLFLAACNLNAKIIYIEPVQNAKYVSINNNIIIGFDARIESADVTTAIKVTGSLSGLHSGRINLSEDMKKLVFIPHEPFRFNEYVTVSLRGIRTSGNSSESVSFTFQTQIDKPEWDYTKSISEEFKHPTIPNFNNINDEMNLPEINVTISNNPAPGHLFLSNFPFTNIPNAPHLLILRNDATPFFSKQMNFNAFDFKKQSNGYLTYFSKQKFYALDNNYNLIDSFFTGNGYLTDLHELILMNNGHALLMSYDPQTVDMSQIVHGGQTDATVIGLIIQEIDENKNVVFQWRSWDYVAITEARHENLTAREVDYIHGNAIELDHDGNILICSRHTSEITKINRSTGEIIWRLGGAHNEFNFVNDPIGFSYQHDIRRISNGNITLYDNGNFTTRSSRAVEYQLNETTKTATLVWEYRRGHTYGFAMGSVQRLSNGNTLISWGATSPTVTEVRPNGEVALEMTLPQNIFTYRTLKYEMPLTLNISVLMEGLYNSSTNLMIPDTLTLYLRNSNPPFSIVDSSKGVLNSSGAGTFKFLSASDITNYYIVVSHRNSLETWSRTRQAFSSGNLTFSFSIADTQAFGNNQVRVDDSPLKFAIYSGDVNKDGIVDAGDLSLVNNASLHSVTGYVAADLNGDNVVDAIDLSIVDNNVFKRVIRIKP